jgi:dephospho-CoA kinase
MKIIGLTGQTGGGKSTAADVLRNNGVYISDADKIAHAVLLPGGGAYSDVISLFGLDILDGERRIDRKKVGAIVFSDPVMLQLHTEATHRHIKRIILEEIGHARFSGCALACIDAPLLIESGLHEICDYIWVVRAEYDIRLKRVMTRDNISEQAARNRIDAQTPLDVLERYADALIDNNGSLCAFTADVLHRMAECIDD